MQYVQNFVSDNKGNVAITAAILALPMLLLAGVGIEFSRISSAENNMRATVDNASVDAARLFRLGPRAQKEIEAFINANSGRNTAQVRIRIHKNKIKIDAKDEIETPLLSTIGQPTTEITASVEVNGPSTSGSQGGDKAKKSTPRNDNKREIARLRRVENSLRKSLNQLRQAGNRLPFQTRARLERKLREQLREVRNRIRQLQTA
ncbi:MAG: pilus assembly protein TadG-related protein [Pseudomonadota bacterium]